MSRNALNMNSFSSCVVLFVLLVLNCSLIQPCAGDICDSCACIEYECDSDNDSCPPPPTIQESYICDGNDDKLATTNRTFDLNSILWPSRNVTVAATFNHFKFTYLTK